MAITCPSCGMENSDAATECRRCRASLVDAPADDLSASLGVICQRCEAYNEPGVARCTTCQSGAAETAAAAKFCSECGTPFVKAPEVDARQPKSDLPPTVSVLMDDVPAEEIPAEDALAEPVPAEEPPAEEPPAEDAPEAWAASTDPTARPAYGSNPETSPID